MLLKTAVGRRLRTKRYGAPEAERKAVDVQSDETRCLKAELKRVTEEHDILKKAAVYFAKTFG
jgi:transposase